MERVISCLNNFTLDPVLYSNRYPQGSRVDQCSLKSSATQTLNPLVEFYGIVQLWELRRAQWTASRHHSSSELERESLQAAGARLPVGFCSESTTFSPTC